MASLKEIKSRIGSVQGTRKVTSAMKMVSAAKLHKAQSMINAMLPYQRSLDSIVSNFLSGETPFTSPYILGEGQAPDLKKRTAIIVFSSNSSLCGAFNYNVIREFASLVLNLRTEGVPETMIDVYAVGKKVEDAVKKMGFSPESYQSLASKPDYKSVFALADSILDKYSKGEVSRVYVIYQHFKSPAVQKVQRELYLPLEISEYKKEQKATAEGWLNNYIVEPSVAYVIESLMPQVLKQKLYTCLADSYASEHAARTIAMQVATDNAEDLIQELTVLYNKSRQQAITAELLDIVAGSTQ
ncbi:MAG: ATP synthase F1 subunit gamma [Bacteroidales bacterium]|nr:ATP synthase F1 subunit gamma [Bacteroidales bacterium]MBP5517920.1 ATP synthase F1 subunit gamma [Bacteroidales bacterium]